MHVFVHNTDLEIYIFIEREFVLQSTALFSNMYLLQHHLLLYLRYISFRTYSYTFLNCLGLWFYSALQATLLRLEICCAVLASHLLNLVVSWIQHKL